MSQTVKQRVRCRVCGKETAAGSRISPPNTYTPRGQTWDMRHVRKHKNAAKEWCGGWVLCGRWIPPKGSGTWHVRIRLRGPRGWYTQGGDASYWDIVSQFRQSEPWKGQFMVYTENRLIERDIKPEYRAPIEAFIEEKAR